MRGLARSDEATLGVASAAGGAPSHPVAKAALLMLGITLTIVLLAAMPLVTG